MISLPWNVAKNALVHPPFLRLSGLLDWTKRILCPALFIHAYWLLSTAAFIATRVAALKLQHQSARLVGHNRFVMITATVAVRVQKRVLLVIPVYLVQKVLILDKVVHRFNQVLVDVVAIVRHANRRHERTGPEAAIFQRVSMLYRNEKVSLPVQDEARARHSVHLAQVVELLRQ